MPAYFSADVGSGGVVMTPPVAARIQPAGAPGLLPHPPSPSAITVAVRPPRAAGPATDREATGRAAVCPVLPDARAMLHTELVHEAVEMDEQLAAERPLGGIAGGHPQQRLGEEVAMALGTAQRLP
jgi:hypothetical protein